MEMLLMGAALAMFGLAVSCLAFGAATREEPVMEPAPALGKEAVKAAAIDARFFAAVPALPVAAANRVPIEALLLQIENHVRLEQAAAACFLESPSATVLHGRTISPLVN
ncbi:MAG: hypothetical protein ABSE42_16360 [Bryobacteraceae bacterium]|jgi:hypothetical protein